VFAENGLVAFKAGEKLAEAVRLRVARRPLPHRLACFERLSVV